MLRNVTLLAFLVYSFASIAQPTQYTTASGTAKINGAAVDPSGTYWCATDNGVTEISSGGTSHTHHLRGTGNNPSYQSIDANNIVVVGGYGVVAYYNGNTWGEYNSSNTSIDQSDFFFKVCVNNANKVYALSASGTLYAHASSGFISIRSTCTSLTRDKVTDAIYARSGTTSGYSIEKFHNGTTTVMPTPSASLPVSFRHVIDLYAHNGRLYASTPGGMLKYNPSSFDWDVISATRPDHIALTDDDTYFMKNNKLHRITGVNQVDTLTNPLYTFDPRWNFFQGEGNDILIGMESTVVRVLPSLIPANLNNTLTNGSIEINFLPTGDVCSELYSGPGITYLGKSVNFASNLWYTANDGSNTITTAPNFRQFEYQTFSGPKADNYDSTYLAKYDRVWTITKEEIETHRSNYSFSFYTAPPSILNWPGSGDVNNGEDQIIAPFEDHNFNGIYEPLKGEVPLIRGHQAAYFIYNDFRGPKSSAGGTGSGMEFQCMAYSYDTTDPAIAKTVFLAVKAINRTNSTLTNVKFGLWSDFDLGYSGDDLMGSDSISQFCYVMNADNNDEGPFGFGANPPAHAMSFLNQPAGGAMYYSNSSSPISGNPNSSSHSNNLLNSHWLNGSPLILENPCGAGCTTSGDGYVSSGVGTRTNWFFNMANNWYQNPTLLDDLRAILYTESTTISSGDYACLDYIYTTAHDPSNANITAQLALLNVYLGEIQQFYMNQSFACLSEGVSIDEESENLLNVYPIPAKSGRKLVITCTSPIQKVELINVNGQVIYTEENNTPSLEFNLTIPHTPPGIYIVKSEVQNGETIMSKVVIEE